MHSTTPLLLPFTSTTLVFGLEWFPLLGGPLRRLSRRLARKYGASHLVLSGEQAGSVGMVCLRKQRPARQVTLHSAAQNLASLFPQGTVALILPLPEHGWWLVAVHEGAVVARTDRVYAAQSQAVAALADLRVAYPQLRDLTDESAASLSLHDLQANSTAVGVLHKVNRWHSVVPMPVQLLALMLTLAAVVPPVWTWARPGKVKHVVQAQPDTHLAWQQALRQATQTRCLHGLQGTQPVLNALYELPVVIAGWQLTQVECSAGRSAWMCQGDYQRRQQTASNDGFLRVMPLHGPVVS